MNNVTKFEIKVPWGLFGLNGEWYPNPLLKMSAYEQYKSNFDNGFMTKAINEMKVTP